MLSQLAVVGGNKTGVFVHQVTEGSAAHTVGISPGAQIVEVGASVYVKTVVKIPPRDAMVFSLIILFPCR